MHAQHDDISESAHAPEGINRRTWKAVDETVIRLTPPMPPGASEAARSRAGSQHFSPEFLTETQAAIRETDAMLDALGANLELMAKLMRTMPRAPLPPVSQSRQQFWQTYALLWLPLVAIMAGFFVVGFYLGGR